MIDTTIINHDYQALTPDRVMDAVESLGYHCDARVFALNSYENRVYQVGIEDQDPLIAKFYRPQRWSEEQIREEHQFTQALFDLGISVVPPLQQPDGNTLAHYQGYHFSLYPRQGGHAPNLDDFDQLLSLGRALGRIHALGQTVPFQHRPTLDIHSFGEASQQYLLEHEFIPPGLIPAYESLSRDLLASCQQIFASVPYQPIRLHGDMHPGNILWREPVPHFVDFDDARNGPAVQDIWMLLSGEREQQTAQLAEILDGYREFASFNLAELGLIEALRSLRLMYYAAWLARRWSDPAFPHNFPWFNTERYWAEHILELREQLAALNEPPLTVY